MVGKSYDPLVASTRRWWCILRCLLALVHDEYWLKLAGRKGAGRNERAGKLWRVGNIKEVGFKAWKKLIARKRECSARVGGSTADVCGKVHRTALKIALSQSWNKSLSTYSLSTIRQHLALNRTMHRFNATGICITSPSERRVQQTWKYYCYKYTLQLWLRQTLLT